MREISDKNINETLMMVAAIISAHRATADDVDDTEIAYALLECAVSVNQTPDYYNFLIHALQECIDKA